MDEITAPRVGRVKPARSGLPRVNKLMACKCSLCLVCMQRITFSSWAMRAQRGISDEKCTPGMEVAMLPNGPLLGRPGLGSQVSNWLGPPHSQSRIIFFCDRRTVSANKGLEKSPWKLVTAVAPEAARPFRKRRRCRRCSSGTQHPGRCSGARSFMPGFNGWSKTPVRRPEPTVILLRQHRWRWVSSAGISCLP